MAANNLYGPMNQYFVIGGFDWLTQDEIARFQKITEKFVSKKVDLEYQKNYMTYQMTIPLVPENIQINKSMLSD